MAAGGAGGSAVMAGGAVLGMLGGPIGWICVGAGGITAAISGIVGAMSSQDRKKLARAAEEINVQMTDVTKRLEKQCVVLVAIVQQLELAADSAAKSRARLRSSAKANQLG